MKKSNNLKGYVLIIVVSTLMLFVSIMALNNVKNEINHLNDVARFYVEHEHNDNNYEIVDVDNDEMTVLIYENGEIDKIAEFDIEYYESLMERKDS